MSDEKNVEGPAALSEPLPHKRTDVALWFAAVAAAIAVIVLCACSANRGTTSAETDAATTGASASTTTSSVLKQVSGEFATGKHHAKIVVKDYGTIEVELDADAAPITVCNFCTLAKAGFYDGLTFHRVIKGFMIQGGDPNGDGTGGSDQCIKGEFSSNGVVNPIRHERGVISMARSSANDSASSQFFIMQEAATHLDGSYAAFGRVTSGIEVVDAICDKVPVTDSNGTVQKADQPVIESVTIVD